jgi:hypothetical protein
MARESRIGKERTVETRVRDTRTDYTEALRAAKAISGAAHEAIATISRGNVVCQGN